jgi:hypothetical protein
MVLKSLSGCDCWRNIGHSVRADIRRLRLLMGVPFDAPLLERT